MHPELAGLLHTARFALDDDAPRLIVADWLEEHGDEDDRARAEYVRVSVALARTRPWDTARAALSERRRELERSHAYAWAQALRAVPGVSTVQHERGLICLHLSADVLDRLSDLFALPAAAWVEGVRCWGWDQAAYGRLLSAPECGRLASLGVGDCLEESVLSPLLQSPHLRQLKHLLVINANLSNGGWSSVVERGVLSPLPHLCLLGNRIGREGVVAMREGGLLDPVRTLDLSQNRVGPQCGQSLALCRLPQLHALELGWNDLADNGMSAVADSPLLSTVEHLEASSNELGPDAAEALAGSPHTGRLASLDLSFNAITDAGAAALARSPLAGRLRSLELRYNRVSDDGVQALIDSPLPGRLVRLDVSGNADITADGLKKLQRSFGEALLS